MMFFDSRACATGMGGIAEIKMLKLLVSVSCAAAPFRSLGDFGAVTSCVSTDGDTGLAPPQGYTFTECLKETTRNEHS